MSVARPTADPGHWGWPGWVLKRLEPKYQEKLRNCQYFNDDLHQFCDNVEESLESVVANKCFFNRKNKY